MAVDIKGAIVGRMNQLKKEISKKSSEVVQLERELKRHQTVLALLVGGNGAGSGKVKRGGGANRAELRAVLSRVSDTFTSKQFVKEAARTKKEPIYIRQTLSRWAREGKIKRLERGKYQKLKKASIHHLAA
jgi:hypothetical protein